MKESDDESAGEEEDRLLPTKASVNMREYFNQADSGSDEEDPGSDSEGILMPSIPAHLWSAEAERVNKYIGKEC